MRDFKVLQGEEVQTTQLLEWKQLLKEEVYVALTIYARKNNHLATCGGDIVRGTALTNFIQNYLMYKRTGRLEKELGLRGYEEYLRGIERIVPRGTLGT